MTVQLFRPRRRWLIASAVVAAVILPATGTLVGLRLFGPERTPAAAAQCGRPTAPISVPPGAAGRAPGGGGLTVTEKGFFSPTQLGEVSIGGVVANSATSAAYRTGVVIRALRADGRSAVSPGHDIFFHQEIPVILPGQRVAVGAMASLDTSGPEPSVVTRVEIELTSTRWIADDLTNPLLRPIIAKPYRLPPSTVGEPHTWVDFAVTGDECAGLATRGTAVVFRDESGAVMGGYLDTARAGNAARRCLGDGSPQQARQGEIPANVDLTDIQISVYCDVAGAPLDPPASEPPVN